MKAQRVVMIALLGVLVAFASGIVTSPFGVTPASAAGGLKPYTVLSPAGPSTAGTTHSVTASCDEGDQATGGGFEGVDFGTTIINDNSPFTSIDSQVVVDSWTLTYTPVTNADSMRVRVVCKDKRPRHQV